MFTGIIQSIGTIKNIKPSGQSLFLTVEDKKVVKQVKNGSSVSVSGVCLTVRDKIKNTFVCEVIPETLKKTSLGNKRIGDRVNLEPSLRVGDELGGHFVYGHIDGVEEIRNWKLEIRNLFVSIPQKLMRYVVPHGSIAIDGVSVTIASVQKSTITIALTDYTLKNTTLRSLQKGDRVNVECDMIAKMMKNCYIATLPHG